MENREYFQEKWAEQEKSEDLLEEYRVKDFQKLVGMRVLSEKMDIGFMLRVLDYIKVFENEEVISCVLGRCENRM